MARVTSGSRGVRTGRLPAPVRIGAVGLASAAMVVAGLQMSAEAAPQKVLQAVDVQLDRDGTIDSISSTAIRKDSDGSVDDDETSHDPSKVGADLPVRVLTSYRHGKKSGTDLDDLKGVDGTVYIDVTVQNTTVRPEVLTYDSEAQSKSAPALVGTPLTVVASADLGDTDLADVVTGNPGAQDARATNGVVSRDSDDDTHVQWATLLAPPRLAPSATFTLVTKASDFEPPAFDISVQPGLVTDTSVSQLVDSAFDDDNGTRELTSSTIALLSSVGTVLTDASTVLAKVEQQLDGSASQLGTKTIADLQRSSSYVTSALGGLAGDLDSLDSTVRSSLNSSGDAAVRQLSTSLDEVKENVLGDADSYDPPEPVPGPTGCTVVTPQGSDQTTVYAQLLDVQAQLDQLAGSTGACRDAVIATLRATIGSDTDSCQTQATAPTALGALACASTAITTASGDLNQLQTNVYATFDETLLAETNESFGAVIGRLDEAKGTLNQLATGDAGSEFEELEADLAAVTDTLTTVDANLATINERAEQQVDLLSGSSGAADQAEDLAEILCDELPASDDVDEASELLSGGACDADPSDDAYDGSIRGKIDTTSEAWAQTAAETDTGADDGVAALVDDLLADVAEISDRLADLIAAGQAAGLQDAVNALNGRVQELYDVRPQPDDADGNPQPDLPSFRDTLVNAFGAFAQNQADVQAQLDPAFAQATSALAAQDDNLTTSRGEIGTARDTASTQTGNLFNTFTASLSGIGDRIVANGAAAIDRQKGELDQQERQFEKTLDRVVKKALTRITKQVDGANADLESSETALVGDLKAILVNIGTPQKNGSGLLGTIYTGARRTGASNSKIADASQLSDAFSRVRGASLDDLYLQQAQVTASLEAEQSFPAFDLQLPAGSSSRTVFSLHVGQD